MKKYLNSLFLKIVIVLLIFPTMLQAQFSNRKLKLNDDTQSHIIRLKSGEKIKGTITSIENEKVWIQSSAEDSLLQLTLSEIKKIRIKGNQLTVPKHFDSALPPTLQLFFSNTAFAMEKGKRNYRTYWGTSLSYSKQVTENVAVGVGFSFPFFVHGKFKVTDKVKDKDRRHGLQLTVAITPVGLADGEGTGTVLELSQTNTWGTTDKFINLTFNYYENGVVEFNSRFEFDTRVYLKRYASMTFGGGIRLGEHLQLHLNEVINFSNRLIDFNVLPSFGINWISGKHHVGIGFMSNNEIGFNFFPLFDSNFDDFIIMEKGLLANLPFFSYSRIF